MPKLLATLLDSDDLAARFEVADETGRLALVGQAFPDVAPLQVLPRMVILQQLADGLDPHVGPTASRLLAAGLEPGEVMVQLSMVVVGQILDAVSDTTSGRGFDGGEYHAALDRLPLPDWFAMRRALVQVASEQVVIDDTELFAAAARELGYAGDDRLVLAALERVAEQLALPEFGSLLWLAGDRAASPTALARGVVLTHVLTGDEVASGRLPVDFDLALFGCLDEPTLEGRPIEREFDDEGRAAWIGPIGWLSRFTAGDMIAVRADGAQRVTLEELPSSPQPADALVALLREVYEHETAEAGGPETALALLAAARAYDPAAFAAAEAPLEVLCAAAGWERRGCWVADDPLVWRRQRRAGQIGRIIDAAGDDPMVYRAAIGLLAVCDRLRDGEQPDPDQMREALDDLCDLEVLVAAEQALLDRSDGEQPAAEVLMPYARRPRHRAAVRYLAALTAEYDGDTLAAEQHLELAHETDPGFGPVNDRLAWYSSDRGDAARAARLWQKVPSTPTITAGLAAIEPFTYSERRDVGRNDPCWCGSGRKYKRCHLGQLEPAPLSDRVGWLWEKACAYVDRYLPAAATVTDVVLARIGHDPDDPGELDEGATLKALSDDPLVMDLVLNEGGWFDRFLADRSVLLPDDEALLAASWATVARTVYEITAVDRGVGLTVSDLRSAEQLQLRERTFSKEATTGDLVCARAVPDGVSHQFIGVVFAVPPGREKHLLDLLDDADPCAIANWVSVLEQPPRLTNREGETLVAVTTVLAIKHPGTLRAHLDTCYESHAPDVWVDSHPLGDDDTILRGWLELRGDRLTVTANSNARADRILARIAERADLPVISDHRRPIDTPEEFATAALQLKPPGIPDNVPPPEAIEQVRSTMERRWCDEPIPALDGLTPRQAFADPTRHEQLHRLLRSYDTASGDNPQNLTLRPQRLRQLLGM